MNGMQVMDRAIAVEQAAIAAKTKEKGTANPYAAIKAAHLQQVMIAQMQQAQLAAQVAAMRVQAKTNPGGVAAPGVFPAPCVILVHKLIIRMIASGCADGFLFGFYML